MDISSPRLMRIAILSAAWQDVVPREEQRLNPLKASMTSALEWIDIARQLRIDLQLSAALPLPDSYIPAEAMLDPVAPHLPVRTFSADDGVDLSDRSAKTLVEACGQDVRICDLGFFENLLHPDPAVRGKIHAHLLRCARAAKQLTPVGCNGVTTFIGRDPTKDMDQNVALFTEYVIPLLREFQRLGLKMYVEQCPMPGWNTTDTFENNIAYCAGMWIKLIRIAQNHGVGDVLHITYDESHDILMGNTHRGSFAAMRYAGLHGNVSRFHGKQQNRNRAKTALWTARGQQIDLGCRNDGQPDPDPRKQGGAWGVMTCDHSMIGIGHYNPMNAVLGNEADWFSHQLAARSILGLNPENTVFILEHEWVPNRVQNKDRVVTMLAHSVRYIRGIDAAADAMWQGQCWAAENGLPVPSIPDPSYEFSGLQALVDGITV